MLIGILGAILGSGNENREKQLVGVMAIHPEVGLSVVDYEEAAAKRAMIEGAADVVAPALAQKLGTVAPFVVCPTSAVTHLITERGVSDELLAPYRALGLTVIRG